MKIIKEGKKDIRLFECPKCGQKFELDMLDKNDVDVHTGSGYFSGFVQVAFCPKCGKQIAIKDEEEEIEER